MTFLELLDTPPLTGLSYIEYCFLNSRSCMRFTEDVICFGWFGVSFELLGVSCFARRLFFVLRRRLPDLLFDSSSFFHRASHIYIFHMYSVYFL